MTDLKPAALVPVYVDRPDLPEIFADSLHTIVWDGHSLRLELCVTRYQNEPSTAAAEARRHPVARLVLTPALAADLTQRLQQTMQAIRQGQGAPSTGRTS
jgi:hypothetical protein